MSRSMPFVAAIVCAFAGVALMAEPPCIMTLRVGGEILDEVRQASVPASLGAPMTFIDVNRPAAARLGVSQVALLMTTNVNATVTMQFASVYASGHSYIVRNKSVPLAFHDLAVAPGSLGVAFPVPLVFEPGDMLAVTLTPSAPNQFATLLVNRIGGSAGVMIGRSDIMADGSLQVDSPSTLLLGQALLAATGSADVTCTDTALPEIIVPVTGNVNGRVHYTTDVSIYTSTAFKFMGPTAVGWQIRDRLQNPNAVTLYSGQLTRKQTTTYGDWITSISGLPVSYLGPMILKFDTRPSQDYAAPSSRFSDEARISARVTAKTSAGDAGSSVPGVSCESIGHVLAIPFHRSGDQRVNIGITSAALNSCGVFTPAKAVIVEVNDYADNVLFQMPAESMQLDDITGPSSPLARARGLTDGVIRVTVVDEATRILGYAAVIDNTSHGGTITIGRVDR